MCAYKMSAAPLLVYFVIACLLIGTDTQSSTTCLTPQGASGVCVDVKICPYLLDILLNNRTTNNDQYLRNSLCEKPQGPNVYVCCESPSCATDDGQAGECMQPAICRAARAVRSPTTRGSCVDDGRVCCSRSSVDGYVSRQSGLPEFGFCGVSETPLSAKIVNRTTSPGQHPWTALLVYRFGSLETERCGGALVSARFVVTAAHCIDNTLVRVRLGVHNLTERCSDVKRGCPFVVDVANTTILPSYDANAHVNDLALVVLSSPAPYMKHIRPICLPDRRTASEVQRNPHFNTAGWGVSRDLSGLLLQLQADTLQSWGELPLRGASVCRGALKMWADLTAHNTDTSLPPRTLCAGGTFRGELCSQDSGGALVWSPAVSEARVLIAVHSKSVAGCRAPVPAIYTPVLPHAEWIAKTTAEYYAKV